MTSPSAGADDPRLALRPDVTVSYSDDALNASWAPIAEASAYHVDVADSSGTVVFSTDVDAATFAPPVPLAFTPTVGAAYTVTVWVRGMTSAPVVVTAVELTPPTLAVAYSAAGADLSWDAVSGGTGYTLEVTLGTATTLVREVTALGSTLTTTDGIEPDTTYSARVRATVGPLVGPWSNQVDVTLRSARTLLTDLSTTLVTARSDAGGGAYAYPIDTATVGGAAAPLIAALGDALSVTAAGDPVLAVDGTELTLTGTTANGTGIGTSVTLTFTAPAGAVTATWAATPPVGFALADLFAVLHGSAFQSLVFRDATVTVASSGMEVHGTIDVRTSLLPSLGGSESDAHAISIGGTVQVGSDRRPTFDWVAGTALPALTVTRIGQDPLVVAGGLVTLRSVPSADPDTNDNALAITGTVNVAGVDHACALDVPTLTTRPLTLKVLDGWAAQTATQALTGSDVADVVNIYLPATFLALAGASVTAWTLTFDPAGGDPTTTTVTLGFGDGAPWAAGVTLDVTGVTAAVARSNGWVGPTAVSYSVAVHARLTIGTTAHDVTATVPSAGPWTVEVTDATLPNLGGITALTDATGVTSILPSSLTSVSSSSPLSRAAIVVDPVVPRLVAVDVTIAQTEPWPVAGLTLAGWSARIVVSRTPTGSTTGWTTAGVLSGSIAIGTGGATVLAVDLPLPPGPDNLWAIGLAEGTTAHVPSIGEILAMLGANTYALPDGLATLGNLDVTSLTVWIDASTATVRQVSFAFDQSGTWSFAGGNVTVSGVAAALALVTGPNGVGASGLLSGVVTVAGTAVDLSAVKNGFDGGWTVEAAVANTVHVPGFTALDSWLSGSAAESYLPAKMPLSAGFDVSDVSFVFDAGGTLASIGFTVEATDFWIIAAGPPALSITDVRATLVVPYGNAAGIVGDISGAVTLGDVAVVVTATKPSGSAPWEFTGTLRENVTIDLAAAIESAAQGVSLVLPTDATAYGLPSSLTIETATVRAVPETGAFHADGALGVDWGFSFGPSQRLELTALGGAVDVAATGAPTTASVYGDLSFAGLDARLSLSFGSAADVPTLLTGVVTPGSAPRIDVAALTDGLATDGATGTWEATVPSGFAPLAFAGATVAVNLTAGTFVVAGAMTCAGKPAASGLVCVEHEPTRWNYVVALRLDPSFRFGDLVTALAVVDTYLHVTDARLVVCDVGSSTLGAVATGIAAALPATDPPITSPLDGLSADTHVLANGVYATATIDFATSDLFARVLQLGDGTTRPAVRVTLLLNRDDPSASTFTANLPDITLLSALVLSGITVAYLPNAASRVTVSGTIAVPTLSLSFDVALTVDDDGATSTVAPTGQQLAAPFDIAGVTITGLAIDVTYVWAKPGVSPSNSVALVGSALLGPAPAPGQPDQRADVEVAVVLLDAQPALMYLALDRDFSIGKFLAQFLTGTGAKWPSTFVDVVFKRESRVYYYDAAVAGERLRTYGGMSFPLNDLVVDATVEVTLIATVEIAGTLQRVTDPTSGEKYLEATLALTAPIDLAVAKLAGTTQDQTGAYTGGPALAIRSGSAPEFGLSTGIMFLGSAFLTADVSVRTVNSQRVFSGSLTAPGPLEPFGTLSCAFSYTTSDTGPGRFEIENWPAFSWAADFLNLLQAIRDLANESASPCGALAGLIMKNAFTTKLNLTPSVTTHDGGLQFALTGSYVLTLASQTDPFVSASLPPWTVTLPLDTTWSTLPANLASALAASAATLAADLLSHPADVAAFLALVCAEDAVKVAAELACDALVDAAVVAATEAAAGVVAAGGALAAVFGAIAKALTESHHSEGGGGSGGSGGGDTGQPITPAVPALTSVAYDSGHVTAAWQSAWGAMSYTFQLVGADGSTLGRASTDFMTFSASIPVNASALAPGTYQAQVQATRHDTASDWASQPIVKPAAPAVTLGYADGALVVSWTGDVAESFAVSLTDPSGTETQATAQGSARSWPFPSEDPADGRYSARVRPVVSGTIPADWSTVATLDFAHGLPAPAVTSVMYADGTITVEWTAAAYAHDARVLTGTTQVATATATDPTATSLVLGAAYEVGTTYTVEVRARTSAGLSPWATSPLEIRAVAAPTNVAARIDADALTVSCDPVVVAGASVTYDVRVAEESTPDTPIGGASSSSPEVPVTLAGGRVPVEGETYAVAVRAIATACASAWTTVTFPVHILAPPTGVTVAVGTSLEISWTAAPPRALPAPLTYDVGLIPPDAPALSGVTGTEATLPATGLAPGTSYVARARAVSGAYASAWASSGQFVAATPLSVAQAAHAAGQSLSEAAGTVAHEFPGITPDALTNALVTAYALGAPATDAGPLATALHTAGVVADDARTELVRVLPGLTAAQLAGALASGYPMPPDECAVQLARFGADPSTAAVALRNAYTPPLDPDVLAKALAPALGLLTPPQAKPLTDALRAARGPASGNDAGIAFALKLAGFAIDDVRPVVSLPAGGATLDEIFTSDWWRAAETARAAGTAVADAATAIVNAVRGVTREHVGAALVGAWYLDDLATGLVPATLAMKAAGFSFDDCVGGLKPQYVAFGPKSFGVMLTAYNDGSAS